MMKPYLLILILIQAAFAQTTANAEQLCQGAYLSEADAESLLKTTLAACPDQKSWEQRATLVREGIREGMTLPQKMKTLRMEPIRHGLRELNGYSVEKVAFESVAGFYVTGNLYRPLGVEGKLPGILCPHGHRDGKMARFEEYTQQRCATLARMGAVVFTFDMIGYGDSQQCSHTLPKALKLQTLNSLRAVDFLMSLPEVDPERIAVTGESGGATQSIFLTALDPRIKVSVPVVMVSAYFFGGCVCESGMPVHKRPGSQTCNAEIAALAAPRPMLLVSVGTDWTKNTPQVELPFLKSIYGLYGAEHSVENVHLMNEEHDYGISKRLAACRFLAKHLQLDLNRVLKDGQLDESPNTILPVADLRVFNDQHPRPAHAVLGDEAVMHLLE